MITIEDVKREFNNLKDKPKFQKQLEFSALVTEYFKSKGIKPIIVGGLSVEIYTRNDYQTYDIDFVSDGWDKFNELLTELGFKRIERDWYHEDAEIAIEIPSAILEGSKEHVYEITLPSNRSIFVIGVEDIIIHRLEGIAFHVRYPKEDTDYEWAQRMYLIHKKHMDIDYLIKEAKRTKVFSLMEDWFEDKQ